MENLVLVLHSLTAIAIVVLILLQQGKGATAGASFGGGASQTVFGSSGSVSFFARVTAIMAVVFFATSFGLAIIAKNKADIGDLGVPAVIESRDAVQDSDIPMVDDDADDGSTIPEVPED
nr:preprotein translocase subunit SecG [Marinimicrobium alkaliphilum]